MRTRDFSKIIIIIIIFFFFCNYKIIDQSSL